jgi:2-polyprenyl-3-methyl-5-hydroxy-6-metoxy-1,4-benzoquinol methylase
LTDSGGCRLCGSEKAEERFPGAGIEIYKCQTCGTVFRDQEVGIENLRELYNEDYYMKTWPGSLGRFFTEFDPDEHHKTRFFNKQLSEFENLCGGPGKLLDVGCANGVFVWMAHERGWEAEGVELSPFAAKWGRKQFDVNITEGTIRDLPPEPAYDVITFWDTIEHLPDPARALRGAYKRLAPGGMLAVLTPDSASLVNRLVHASHKVAPGFTGPYLEKLYHKDHLTYFDRETLGRALCEQGFEIHWLIGYDEDPTDTETSGLLRAGVFIARMAAMIIGRQHEILVWAAKPRPKHRLN